MVSSNRSRILKNALITMAGKYGEYILALLSSAIIARALGPTEYGVYAYIIWISGWMIRLSNISLPLTIIRFVAECRGSGYPEHGDHLAHHYSSQQSLTTLLVCLSFSLGIYFFRPEALKEHSFEIVGLICVAVFFKARYMYLVALAKGYERFDFEAIASVLVGIISIGMVAILAWYQEPVSSFVCAFALTSLFLAIAIALMLRFNKIRISRGELPESLLSRAKSFRRATFLLGAVSVFGNRSIEMFLIGQFASTQDVGYLSIAGALTRGLVDLLTVGLTAVLMPAMASAFGGKQNDRINRLFSESTKYYLFFGLAIAVSSFFISKPVIQIIYGSEFLAGSWVMTVVMFSSGLSLSTVSVGSYLSTTERQDLRVKFALAVLGFNLLIAAVLVPRFGLNGALISIFSSAIFSTCIGFQWVARNIEGSLPYGVYSRIILAASCSALPCLWLNYNIRFTLAWLVYAGLFAALYLLFSVLLKCWNNDDYRMVGSIASKLPPILAKPIQRMVKALSAEPK